MVPFSASAPEGHMEAKGSRERTDGDNRSKCRDRTEDPSVTNPPTFVHALEWF